MGGGVILNSDKKAKNVPITTKVKKFKSRCFFSVFEQKSFDSWKTKKIRKKIDDGQKQPLKAMTFLLDVQI
jgi:hypothetical protein